MKRAGAGHLLRCTGSIAGIALIALFAKGIYAANWNDYTAPIDDRVADLMTKVTTAQKITLRDKTSPAISGLALPIGAVQWWTEMQNGRSTIFPAAIGKVCTWDPDLMYSVGQVYGVEGRAAYLSAGQQFFSPCEVNLALDPRDGRNDETWGEDPYLAGVLAGQLVKGAQGNKQYVMPGGGEYYLRIGLMAKHLIANNHEASRYNDISDVTERDFFDWFLPPFKALCDADVAGIMTGLNPLTIEGTYKAQVNNAQCDECAFTMDTIPRVWWGWKGYITCDCEGVGAGQHETAMERGLDAECHDGLESEMTPANVNLADLNRAVSRLFRLRMRQGEFDPVAACPYKSQPAPDLNANALVALQAAREAVVLAKNNNNLLPIDTTVVKKIVLIGPVADHPAENGTAQVGSAQQNFFGGYSGWPALSGAVTNLHQAVQKVATANGMTFTFIGGMNQTNGVSCINATGFTFAKADSAAIIAADVVIAAVGTENNDNRSGSNNVPCQLDDLYPGEGRDLTNINLPGVQDAMVGAIYKLNKKVVVVVQDQEVRSAPNCFDSCPAVVVSLTGGQAVGTGIADVLFGKFNPSGKMAQTWMRNITDYPAKSSCAVRGVRTYWYFTKPIFFPFGHGLSYTTFAYSNISHAMAKTDTVTTISFTLQNNGTRDGAEVAQLYVHALNTLPVRPLKELRNFKRVNLTKGASANVSLSLVTRDFSCWDTVTKAYVAPAGKYEIMIGSSSADIRLRDTVTIPVTTAILPQQQHAQSVNTMKTKQVQCVYVDSHTAHYSFKAANGFDIFTADGKKIVPSKGVDVNSFLSHAARGVYIIKQR